LAFLFLHAFDACERHSHVEPWFDISASLGFYQAAGILAAVTVAAAYRFMVGQHGQ